MKSKIKHIQLNRVQFFVGKDKRQKVLPTTCHARHPFSLSLHPPAGSQTQSPSGCWGVAGGSQPPKGEKLYRYNGIAERTIRCVFARRFDCHRCCCCPRCCCCWPSALCCNEASWRGTRKYGRIMPNISADNCADYEVNLSAAKRMSRHSKGGGVRDGKRRREREEEEEWEPAKVLWLWSLQVLAGLAFWLLLLYFSDCCAKGWHA